MESQEIPTIEQEKEVGVSKQDGTLEASDQRIDPVVPLLAEEELLVTISPAKIATPDKMPGGRRSYQVKFQTKPYYIPSMSVKKY